MNDSQRHASQAAVERPIAAALTGRTSRSQVAASQSINRGSKGQGPRNTAEKSLDTLRVVLQKYVNLELDALLQKYVKLYFEPAIHNLRNSSSQEISGDDLLKSMLCRTLEEAKKMYEPPSPPPAPIPAITFSASPYSNVSEVESIHEPFARYGQRRDSDGDSYSSAGSSVKRIKTERTRKGPGAPRKVQEQPKPLHSNVDMSVPEGTKFMLGSSANRVLGYENARGRIYSKHPDLFKYVGDQEDKQWLFENKIMTAAGGKAFLVFAEDIREILRTEPSSTTPRKNAVNGAKEFTIPGFMLEKVRAATQRHTASGSGRSRSGSTASSPFSQNSNSPTPTEPGHEDEREPTVTPPLPHYNNSQVVNQRNPYGQNSPEGFFSPLMDDNDVFTGENDVFTTQDSEFAAGGPSLDSINPTIGNFHSHELGQLGHLDF